MKGSYQICTKEDKEKLVGFLAQEGQALLPMVELIEDARLAVDEVIDVVGRATVEAVLELSARGVAGPKHQGKPGGGICWYGKQAGRVCLSERKLRVRRPRLRRKSNRRGSEVEVPAYSAMAGNPRMGRRMLEILLAGISTRRYQHVIQEMADTVGVSKSEVSREFVPDQCQGARAVDGAAV